MSVEKVVVDTSTWKQKTTNVLLDSSFTLRLARGVGQVASRLVYEPDQLLVHVSNKIKQLDYIRDKEKSFFGRMANKLAKEETEVIQLDGIVVKQMFETIGQELPFAVDINSQYRIFHEDVRRMHALCEIATAAAKDDQPEA